jgi:DDE family transposase
MKWSKAARWWPRFDGGQMTSDAGALLLGAANRALGLVRRLARCFTDGRAPELVEHTVETMLMPRICGIALGYEDLVDHDQLRHDPVLATLAGKLEARRKDCAPLAGKSTLNRLEHAPASALDRYHKIGHDPDAIEDLFVELFREVHRTPPQELILDLDATDDPLHGHQEGRFFHGYGACPPAALGPTGGTVTATCHCTCFAAGICSRPSCGARTSMRPPAPRMKWPASSARSGRAGRGSRSCCAPTPALPVTS